MKCRTLLEYWYLEATGEYKTDEEIRALEKLALNAQEVKK